MIRSILYVSRSNLDPRTADEEVSLIVRVSVAWNAIAGITGALAFTGARFAQFIEGPADGIAELLDRLHREDRHSQLAVVLDEEAKERRFSSWQMAYSGPADLLAPQLEPLTRGGGTTNRHPAAEDLISLMQAFTTR
jgi:hypothetical protein